ncbi:MAG: right-handed parallel beta-helix repeat-containing protein [bacterium]
MHPERTVRSQTTALTMTPPSAVRPSLSALAPGWTAAASALALVMAGAASVQAGAMRRVPEDFASIPAAVVASAPGDTILVGPGKWTGFVALTDKSGEGLVLRAAAGPEKTTIVYGDSADVNLAVITFQRCSDATRLIGFSIDGRSVARYGVLVGSDSKPRLEDVSIAGCEFGVASVRGAAPTLRGVTTRESHTAGLFVSAGTADVQDSRFLKGDKFGVYVGATSAPVQLRNVEASENAQAGVQVIDGELAFDGGTVAKNGDVGILVQGSSPRISRVTVSDQKGVGVVLERSSATLDGCTVRGNEFGAVASLEGEPHVVRCTFADNRTYHFGVEGAAGPVVGGSLAEANRFLGSPALRLQTSSSSRVNATFDFWDAACPSDSLFKRLGTGELAHAPWASADLLRSFGDCDSARAYAPGPPQAGAGDSTSAKR